MITPDLRRQFWQLLALVPVTLLGAAVLASMAVSIHAGLPS